MNLRVYIFTLLVLSMSSVASAADLSKHVFFKHLIGKWTAEGELKGADNNVVKITEEWTGKADVDGSFFIEGSRTINGDTQPFKWSITHNPATDSYEAVLAGAEDSQTLRFEGSLSEVDLTMTLKSITGSGESSIIVEDSFANEAKDTMQSKVKFSGDQGQTNLEGKIIHKREKAP
jgi:hypothetical protein